MSEKIKNPLLAILLISLCFMIKCKLDNDKPASKEAATVEAPIAEPKKEETNQANSNNTKEDSKTITKATPKENIPAEEKEAIKSSPVKKEVKKPAQKKASPPKKNTKKKKTAPAKKPKIEFEELVWNFGEITEGDIIDKKFKFTNTGNAPLAIIATSATCGCTRPSFPFLDIAPGESNVIGVNYNSVGKDGEQHPEVTVESNADPKVIIIKLHGTVKPKPKKEEKIDSTSAVKDTSESKH